MTKLNATAKLVENYRIDVDDGRYHAVCLDIDQDSGGSDMGPSGLELALMSLVGCYATIMMLTASKMRATVSDLEVKGTATKTQEAGTIIEAKLEIAIRSSMTEDRVHRLHELTVKGCPVGILFEKAGVKMTYNLTLRKA